MSDQSDKVFMATEPFPWTCGIKLPDMIEYHVNDLLKLAASCNATGIEMRLVFIGIKADGKGVLFDASALPSKDLVAPWVMMGLEKEKCVAVIMCCEGYSLPQEVAKKWAEGNRTHKNISDHPEAFEILSMTIETQLGSWAGQTKFVGTLPDRTVEGPLELIKSDKMAGRFSNLLPCHREQKEDLLQTLLQGALAARGMIKDEEDSPDQPDVATS